MHIGSIKILAEKAQSFERRGEPGKDALKPQDVAGALSKADPVASMLGRLIYANQTEFFDEIRREMLLQVAGDPRAQKWESPRKGWITDLCSMALIEAMREQALTEDEQACFMRMPFYRWKRHWRREYVRVVASLTDQWIDDLKFAIRHE